MVPVILVKAHVRAYDKHSASGQLVHVEEHEDKRPNARQLLRETTARASSSILGILARHKATEAPERLSSAEKPAPAKEDKPEPRYKKTVYSGKKPQEQHYDVGKPTAAVTVGVQRIKEHGHNQIASDFANLPLKEHAEFMNWLKVYDKELADNPDLTIAEKYMRAVRRQAGMPEKPEKEDDIKGEREKQTDAQKQAFRDKIEKVPEGTAFIIPQSDTKELVGKWEKVDVGGEVYWKKGQKYQPSDAFIGHADLVKRQLKQGGAKSPKLVVRHTRATKKEVIRPLEEQQGEARKEAVEQKPEDVKEGTAIRLPKELQGKEAKVWTEEGTEITVKYAVLPRANLITSHDTSLRENKAFPQELQPRDRARAGLEDQVNNIMQKLTPERLGENPNAGDGAPIVSKDGVVESGNGRTIALGRAYEQKHENAGKYQEWLKANAGKFGLTVEAVEGVKEPVLVRIRTSDVDRKAFVGEANVSTQAAMSASERAMADAGKLTPDVMRWFAPDDEGDVTAKTNGQFVQRFFRDVIGASERNLYLTDQGDLNQEGVRRVKNAVLARAFPDAQLVANLTESTSTTMRNVGNALVGASPRLAQLRDSIARGECFPLDAGAEIAAAANKLNYLKREKMPVEDYLNQQQMFGEDMSPLGKAFLQVMSEHARKPKALKEFLGTYAEMAEAAGDPRQTGMFSQKPPTKEEIFEATRRMVAKRAEGAEDEAGLFKSAGRSSERTTIPVCPVTVGTQNRAAGPFRDGRRTAVIPVRRIKAKTQWKGLSINIEQPVNSVRYWKDGDGTVGGTRFAYAYGEFPDVMGMDGDPLDVFLGPDLDAGKVYVITILKKPDLKEEDEEKVMVGFRSRADAENAFLLHYDDPRMIGKIEEKDADIYAMWLKNSQAIRTSLLTGGLR